MKSDVSQRVGTRAISVNGIWMRRRGLTVQLLAEVDGEWRLIATEHMDGAFSHIVEPDGIANAPRDPGGSDADRS